MKNYVLITYTLIWFLAACKKDKEGATIVNATVKDSKTGNPLKGYKMYLVEYDSRILNNRRERTILSAITDSAGQLFMHFKAELKHNYYLSSHEENGPYLINNYVNPAYCGYHIQINLKETEANKVEVRPKHTGVVKFKFINEAPIDTFDIFGISGYGPFKNFYSDTSIFVGSCGEDEVKILYGYQKDGKYVQFEKFGKTNAYDTSEVIINF